MSAGTDKLDAAMAKHSANKDACQAANLASANANANFSSSAQEVEDAIQTVISETKELASASAQKPTPPITPDPAP